MAKLFNVNLPDGLSTVKLDLQGRATVQYTIKNVAARSLDGRGVLISLPVTRPPKGAVENGWVKIDGTTDRHFDVDKEETFVVKIQVPLKTAQAGDYTFRLDTVWVNQPDQGDAGAAIRFTVPKVEPKTNKFPLWLIPVIAVVVIGIGVGIWFMIPHNPTVPDLTGMTKDAAKSALKDNNLKLGTVSGTGTVTSQTPTAPAKAKKGDAVNITLGGASSTSAPSTGTTTTAPPATTTAPATGTTTVKPVQAYPYRPYEPIRQRPSQPVYRPQ
jgi:hypothetical protein